MRQPRRQVLHKQIYRRNAFGGTTNHEGEGHD